MVLIVVVLALLNVLQIGWNILANRFIQGVIPTEEAALEVGRALLNSIYGERQSEYPLSVIFDEKRNAWFVSEVLPDNYVGATVGILFRKSDGKVLKINSGM